MRRERACRLGIPAVGLVVAVAVVCGGGAGTRGGSWSSAAPTPAELATATVAVVPAGEVVLSESVTAAGDSLTPVLSVYTGAVLATVLVAGGVVGRAFGPDGIATPLVAIGEDTVVEMHAGLDRAKPLGVTDGRLDPRAADAFATLSGVAGTRLVLVPRRIAFERAEIMEWRARLRVYLVDAGSGRVVRRTETVAEDPLPPTGRSPDLLLAALERSARAAAEAIAERLRRPEGEDPDRFGEGTPS